MRKLLLICLALSVMFMFVGVTFAADSSTVNGWVADSKCFALRPLWARFLIVFAGPGMNFVLAALIFMLVFATVGRPVWPPLIGRVAEGTPAAETGLKTGDLIVAVDGRPVRHWED